MRISNWSLYDLTCIVGVRQPAVFAQRTAATASWHWPRSTLRHWRRATSSHGVRCSPIGSSTSGDKAWDRTRRSSYRPPKPPVTACDRRRRLTVTRGRLKSWCSWLSFTRIVRSAEPGAAAGGPHRPLRAVPHRRGTTGAGEARQPTLAPREGRLDAHPPVLAISDSGGCPYCARGWAARRRYVVCVLRSAASAAVRPVTPSLR